MRYSIRARLILVFISLAVGPLLVVGTVLSWQNWQGLGQQALVLQQEAARRATSQVAAFFQELENEMQLTVQAQLLGEPDRDVQRTALSNLLAYQRAFDELHLLDSQGQEQVGVYRIGLGSTAPVDRARADEFLIPYSTGQVYYGPVGYDPVTNEPLMTIAIPVINLRTGLADGVLVAVARIKTVWDLIAGIQVGEGQSVYIVDAEGKVVAHRNPSVVLRGTSFSVPEESGIQPGLSGERVVLAFDTMNLGQQRLKIVAEQAVSQALALAFNTILISAGLIVIALIFASVVGVVIVHQIVQPIQTMAAAAQAISANRDLSQQIPVTRQDELGVLASSFNSMTVQLRSLVGGLEQRVEERTSELAQRSRYLEATAQVGQAAASMLDADELVKQVVELVRERFGLYYVGLFLVDETGTWAVLQAGTGAAGRAMLARGHRIRVGSGMIGWSVAFGESRVALEASADAVRLVAAELPETRSEAALPLRSRGEILGALSVQSTEPGFFRQDMIAVLQTVSDQVAVAVSNARLFQQSREALEAERRASREAGVEAWAQLLSRQAGLGYRCDDRGARRLRQDFLPESPSDPGSSGGLHEPEGTGQVVDKVELPELVVPVVTHGQVLGKIEAHKAGPGAWTEEEITLMNSLGDQLSVALESARLYQDSQRRAARERLLADVGVHIRETLDMDTVLRTALEEIGRSLDLAEVEVRMSTEQARGYSGEARGYSGEA